MTGKRKVQIPVAVDANEAKPGFQALKDGGRDMAASLAQSAAQAKQSLGGIGDGADQGAQKIDRAQKAIVQSVRRAQSDFERELGKAQAAQRGLGDSRAAQLEELAKVRGVDTTALRPYFTQLQEIEQRTRAAQRGLGVIPPALQKVGDTAQNTARQMAMVAPQMTDIVTSLISGQSPFLVAIQQGGQLKDVFGGLGNAARALGGYLVSLINPVTVAAAVLGTVLFAAYKGADQVSEFNKQIILSGNAASVTSSQYRQMARDLTETFGGSQGAALEGLGIIATQARASGDQVQRFTGLAQQMHRLAGKPIADTAREFASLAESPVEASLKLTEKYNYLTSAVYLQIKALQEQGRETEAARLAQESFANAIASRVPAMTEQLGRVETAWKFIADAARGAWEVINARPPSVQDQIDKTQARIEAMEKERAMTGSFGREGIDRGLVVLRERLRLLTEADKASAGTSAKDREKLQATESYMQLVGKYKSDEKRTEEEIARIRTLGAAAGRDQALIEKDVAAVRAKNAKSTGNSELADIVARTKAQQQYLDLLKTQGAQALELTESERMVLKIREELRGNLTATQRAAKEKLLTAAQELVAVDKAVDSQRRTIEGQQASIKAYDALVDATLRQVDALRQQADEAEAANAVWGAGKAAVEEYRLAILQAKLAEAEGGSDGSYRADYVAGLRAQVDQQQRKVTAARASDYKELTQRASEYTRQVEEELRLTREDLSLVGLLPNERERIVAVRRIELKLAQDLAAVDRAGIEPSQRADLVARYTAAAEQAKQLAGMRSELDGLNGIIDSVDRTAQQMWTDFTQSGVDAAERVGRTIKASVADVLYQLTLRRWTIQLTTSVLGSLGLSTGGAGGGGGAGLLDLASLGNSAYKMLTGNPVLQQIGSYLGISGGTAAAAGSAALAGTNVGIATAAGATVAEATAAASAAAAAGATTAASGIMSTFMAAAPYAAIAGLVISALAGKGGGPKADGKSGITYSDIGISDNSLATVTNPALKTLQEQYGTLSRALGGRADIQFGLGVSTDPAGDAPTILEMAATRSGQLLWQTVNRTVGRESAELAKTLEIAIVDGVIGGLMGDDGVKQIYKDYLKQFTSAVGEEGLQLKTAALATIQAVQTYTRTFETFGGVFGKLEGTSISAREAMVKAAGGIDALMSSASAYVENFMSAEERRTATWRSLVRDFAELGQVLPSTAAGYRALVDSLDPEKDGPLIARLQQLGPAFASVYGSVDSLIDTMRTNTDNAMSALERAVARQRGPLEKSREVAQELVQEVTELFDLLHDQVRSLYAQVDSVAQAQAARGQAFIAQALTAARLTGALPDSDELREAIEDARAGIDNSVYASKAESDFARLVLAGQLSELGSVTGGQLTVAEQQLKAAEDGLQALDGILEAQRDQIEELRYGRQTVEQALAALTAALVGERTGTGAAKDPAAAAASAALQAVHTYGQQYGPDAYYLTSSNNFSAKQSSVNELARITGQAVDDVWRSAFGYSEAYWREVQRLYDSGDHPSVGSMIDFDKVPRLARGTNRMPSDMLAILHKDEQVTPAAYNPMLNPNAAPGSASDAAFAAFMSRFDQYMEGASSSHEDARRTREVLESVTEGGNVMRTYAA